MAAQRMNINDHRHASDGGQAAPRRASTVIWGEAVERGDFLKVPRALTRLGRYSDQMGQALQPRHIILLLALAGRQFRDEPIRARWLDLARDLGCKPDTVRKWAYELKKIGLLRIKRTTRDDALDHRNSFDILPFVELVGDAYEHRQTERQSANSD